MARPTLLIHGGTSSKMPSKQSTLALQDSMQKILRAAYALLSQGASAQDAVVQAIVLLENDPLYNAGYGSKLQSDGKIRMSAGLMDGKTKRFSGVVNIQNLKNPILLAQELQKEDDRVLDGDGGRTY